MAKIPIADIPNAPQPVAMPTGGNLQGVSLAGAASLLQQPGIPQGAFDGPARGAEALAKGLDSFGSALSGIGIHLKEQMDFNQVQKANLALTEAHGMASKEIAENPTDPAKWGEIMARNLDSARETVLGDPELSSSARQKITQHFDLFKVKSVQDAQLSGVKTLFEQNKRYALDDINHLIQVGDTETAVALINEHRGKLFFDGEANGLQSHAVQQGEILAAEREIKADPEKARETLSDEKNFPSIPAMQRMRMIDQTENEQKRQDAESMGSLADSIGTRSISSVEDVKSIYGEQFATRHAGAIKSMFAANPDWDKAKESYLKINDEIAKIEPGDPKASGRKFDLIIAIHSMLPEGFRQDSLRALNSKFEDKPESSLNTFLSQSLSSAEKAGLFGKWDEKLLDKGGNESSGEFGKKATALRSIFQVQQDGKQWIKQNPGSSVEDFQKWLNQRMSREMKANPDDRGFWQRNAPNWLGGKDAPSVPLLDGADAAGNAIKKYRGNGG